ncbi:hypothetical protein ACSBR2_038080 [Camellia fascicularis]
MNRGIHEECDHLVQLAKDKLKKSMVADIESGKSVESKVRISSGMLLNKAQSHKRAAHWKIGVSHIVTCCASSSRKIVLREKMRLLLMMSWRKGAEMRALTHKI